MVTSLSCAQVGVAAQHRPLARADRDGAGHVRSVTAVLGQPFRYILHDRASRLSVQEVPALEQQFPPPDQDHAATEIEIDRDGLGGAADHQQPKKERLSQHGGR